ncbi:hypothetical protein BGZ61DRAFT_101845 [Ilyonectria robusta]|uniref:uncharacterized protein n=1 Tax=Ilyonectria robusta TaxID=1079257 RepID=UPI001E8E553B|nr:uncharacterized protein BGZ61DRAFT_101845 [Ilyonectria robusta]KAH8672985.1 hypothetical protein BGZ61DRAFT_101845 [Ilyonectria robusta]
MGLCLRENRLCYSPKVCEKTKQANERVKFFFFFAIGFVYCVLFVTGIQCHFGVERIGSNLFGSYVLLMFRAGLFVRLTSRLIWTGVVVFAVENEERLLWFRAVNVRTSRAQPRVSVRSSRRDETATAEGLKTNKHPSDKANWLMSCRSPPSQSLLAVSPGESLLGLTLPGGGLDLTLAFPGLRAASHPEPTTRSRPRGYRAFPGTQRAGNAP